MVVRYSWFCEKWSLAVLNIVCVLDIQGASSCYDCDPSETWVYTKRTVHNVKSPRREMTGSREAVRVIITFSCKVHLYTTRLIMRPIVIEGKCNRISWFCKGLRLVVNRTWHNGSAKWVFVSAAPWGSAAPSPSPLTVLVCMIWIIVRWLIRTSLRHCSLSYRLYFYHQLPKSI